MIIKYSELLDKSIEKVDLSLAQICRRVKLLGVNINPSYLSKLKNGKIPPASDGLNESLAKVLGIEPIELKAAAYIAKIPPDVIERIKKMA